MAEFTSVLVLNLNSETGACNWAFLWPDHEFQYFSINPCSYILSGQVHIMSFFAFLVTGPNGPYGGGHTDPSIVYQNNKKYCFYFDRFSMTYEQ